MGVDGATQRGDELARDLGAAVASNGTLFEELLPHLLQRADRTWPFGRGLAAASPDPRATWTKLLRGLGQIAAEHRNVQVVRGFVAELWEQDRHLALLDAALEEPALAPFILVLQTAVGLDERGAARLTRALNEGLAPISIYENLAFGRATDHLD